MKEPNKEELKRIAYNCRKATFLIEKKQLGKITVREKFELRVHLATCSICCIFEKQSIVINKMMKDMFHIAQKDQQMLDTNFKKIMQEKIEERLGRK